MRCLTRIAACLACAAVLGARAEVRTATEDQVRAGFLFQLAQYASWPADAYPSEASPLRFCVVGQDELVDNLEGIVSGKTIQGRAIVIARIRDLGGLQGCHLAFIGWKRVSQLRDALARWSYPPILLVGEAAGFSEAGGMVNLIIRSGRVSFEINLEAAGRARIEFRSQLLRFAHLVGAQTRGAR